MNSIKLNKERLIQCRQKLKITKQEAAKRMNLSQPAYLRYESGERMPSLHTIQVMADVFNTSAEYLTGMTNNPHPNIYVIKSSSDPELFEFIDLYQNSNTDVKNRLLSYLKDINPNK